MVEKLTGHQKFKNEEKMENNENNLTLSDDIISQIAKLIQVAILTGTDIVDNLRTMQLVVENDKVYCESNYREQFNTNVERMLAEIPQAAAASINLTTVDN